MRISNLLRKTKLLALADKGYYHWERIKNRKENAQFLRHHPEVKLPPDYLMFESFQINYSKYYYSGKATADEILNRLKKHQSLDGIKLLDWGCGPGRVVRHMPNLLQGESEVYATDYNAKSIEWCKNNLEDIQFNHNTLEAKLPYPDNFFDVLYGISIFTHLSEKMHYEWFDELYRVLSPGGVAYLSFQGDNYIEKMEPGERRAYQEGKIVVRGEVKEGHRIYSAFHPKAFLEKLFKDLKILEQIVIKPVDGWYPQDIWIARK